VAATLRQACSLLLVQSLERVSSDHLCPLLANTPSVMGVNPSSPSALANVGQESSTDESGLAMKGDWVEESAM
jgi:hypothetical protein